MDAWDNLNRELDNWGREERIASFWWRDDDAADITSALESLLDVSTGQDIPISLAIVPANLTPAFCARNFPSLVQLAQHGYAHINHAPPQDKKSEFGKDRDHDQSIDDIAEGFRVLMTLKNAIGLFVPPWNRMDMALLPAMHNVGLRAVSTFTPRKSAEPVPGMIQVNTHGDIMDWQGSRGFVGDEQVIGQVVKHLEQRRTGEVDPHEPTGLLTHHLVHDTACWRFLETFTDRIRNHPAARWVPVDGAFGA